MPTINVKNIAELTAALVDANAGATINVKAGNYDITQTLVVPKGVSLEGVGHMQGAYSASGLKPSPQTRLKAAASLTGDIMRLSDGVSLKGLTIEDMPGRKGNLVAVTSTKAGDRIAVRIKYCELINPNPSGAQPAGPIGRSLLVVTRNPIEANPPAPHEGAMLTVDMSHSVIRSPGNGSGVFAINFAPRGRVFLQLSRNRIGGGIDANGGVSRPVPVTGAQTRILSDRNLYVSDGGLPRTGAGWLLHGGSNPPVAAFVAPYTQGNALIMRSYRDTIRGFEVGVIAAGGWRPLAASGPVSFNCADIDLDTTTLEDLDSRFVLMGAKAGVAGATFPPGDDNRLRVTGSPFWTNGTVPVPELGTSVFRHAATGDGTDLPAAGAGNCLELYGIKFDNGEVGYLEEFYCGPRFDASGP